MVVVVPVLVLGRLVARAFARQLHRLQRSILQQGLDVAVDRGHAQALHGFARAVQHLLRGEGALGICNRRQDGGALPGGSFHGGAVPQGLLLITNYQ